MPAAPARRSASYRASRVWGPGTVGRVGLHPGAAQGLLALWCGDAWGFEPVAYCVVHVGGRLGKDQGSPSWGRCMVVRSPTCLTGGRRLQSASFVRWPVWDRGPRGTRGSPAWEASYGGPTSGLGPRSSCSLGGWHLRPDPDLGLNGSGELHVDLVRVRVWPPLAFLARWRRLVLFTRFLLESPC